MSAFEKLGRNHVVNDPFDKQCRSRTHRIGSKTMIVPFLKRCDGCTKLIRYRTSKCVFLRSKLYLGIIIKDCVQIDEITGVIKISKKD